MKQGFIIPVYRHGVSAGQVAERLSSFGLPIIVVDDGNDAETKKCLINWTAKVPGAVLVSLEKNSGKGVAVTEGLHKAAELGLTHVLQIDADGQHDVEQACFFLEESAGNPENIICGYPEFDVSAPKSRVKGRKISTFWAAVVTLSGELKDALCGFRVYPVDAAFRVAGYPFLDKRMGFDPEILVRLYWRRVFPLFYPVKVSYPEGGISNFHVLKDNMRISWTFCRLCIGMLIRLPYLIVIGTQRRRMKKT
jgi:glycosyltransferase involved in cell wall biosynthesis